MAKIMLIIVVLILAAAGAGYVWYSGMMNQPAPEPVSSNQYAPAPADDAAAIERDLQSVAVDGLDAGLKDVEKEMVK